MTDETKCPKCAAVASVASVWLCGSTVDGIYQSTACRFAERDRRIAELEAELAEIRDLWLAEIGMKNQAEAELAALRETCRRWERLESRMSRIRVYDNRQIAREFSKLSDCFEMIGLWDAEQKGAPDAK